MDQPDISVIVSTYNRAELLRGALLDLIRQETEGAFSFEILVVDDGSTDETSRVVHEIVARTDVPVRYMREEGKGMSEARNRGIAQTKGEWITVFDDDQRSEPDWLKRLLYGAREAGALCVGGIRRLRFPGGSAPHLGPVARSLLGEKIYRGSPGIIADKGNPIGGTFLITRKLFDAVGPFFGCLSTRGLDMGGEDIDFMMRIRRAGYSIWTVPSAVSYHLIPSHRLTYAHLRWASLRFGAQLAQIDLRHRGRTGTFGLCLARLGQALLINVPLFVVALLSNDRSGHLDRKLLLWRAMGYTGQYLCTVFPRVLDPERFSSALEFRQERGALGPKL